MQWVHLSGQTGLAGVRVLTDPGPTPILVIGTSFAGRSGGRVEPDGGPSPRSPGVLGECRWASWCSTG